MIDYYTRNFSDYPKDKIKLPNNKSWNIHDKIYKIKLTKKQGETIIINRNIFHVRYLALPFHRFSKNYYVIILEEKEYILKEILEMIYLFYNKKSLSYQELKSLNSNDVYDYIDNQCKKIKKDPYTNVYPIDIMGAKNRFEGIMIEEDSVGDIQYTLLLGS